MIARKRACIIAALLYLTVTLSAQNPTAQAARLALQSPHDAMWVHLFYLQPDSYRPDLSATAMPTSLDSVERVNAAVKLKQVLDGRGLFVHMNLLPTEADYIDTITQKFFFTPFPDDLPEIFLERDGTSWRYAQASAAVIAVLHKKVYPFGIDRLIGLFSGSTQ
ncbi:MAG: hypothetical protein OEQ53_14430, partial [Saprospiraceae bacterium]|nr:hypothetical protein [Saprospiraceae bacterium]